MQLKDKGAFLALGQLKAKAVGALLALGLLAAPFVHANLPAPLALPPVRITLMHTNDLHSHFRPEKTKLGLGGVARIKSAVAQIRKENPNSFLVDGGDWSEGHIYYNSSAGQETLEMMEHLTYDVATLGNHDWINGPDLLLDTYSKTSRRVALVGANLDTRRYDRREEFRKIIPPYVIREAGGAKIAFIGLTTFEFIYDSFFTPIRIRQPFQVVSHWAKHLRSQVDAIVVVSHNNTLINEQLARFIPEVDLVVGAHDHKKFTKPIVIERSGAQPAWVVEAGCWGRYLGRVDFDVTPGKPASLRWVGGRLIQMDRKIPEHPETRARIERLEKAIEDIEGPVFHDHVGDSHIEIGRHGLDNLAGNLATDAYRNITRADLALDQAAFIYGELHQGPITTSDVFNFSPGVFDPARNRAWTLKTIPMSGRTLNWILNLLFSSNQLAEAGILSVSGLQTTYNPVFRTGMKALIHEEMAPDLYFLMSLNDPRKRGSGFSTKNTMINGEPLDVNRTYRVAISGGMYHAIEFVNGLIPNAIPLHQAVETGLESWRVVADYIRSITPLTPQKLPAGARIRSEQADLGIFESDIQWTVVQKTANSVRVKVTAKIHNFGASTAFRQKGTILRILGNRNGTNTAVDPNWVDLGLPQAIAMLEPGQSQEADWEVQVPGDQDLYPLTLQLEGTANEANRSNDQVTVWISAQNK